MSQPPDIFGELLSLCTPERLLEHPKATGENVPVCVLDSGMEEAVLRERAAGRGQEIHPIQGGVFLPDRPEPLPYEGKQSTPHGTTVADILLTLAPRVRLYSADVLGPRGSCEVEDILRALRWAVEEWKCKVINLSLGVTEQRLWPVQRRTQLHRAIEDAYFKDVLVIAAAHNEHPFTRSYPALFSPPLLSVDKGEIENPLRVAYRLRERVELQAYARGYFGPFANEPATSWAAPHLSGIVARLLSLKPNLKPFEVKTLLYWMAEPGPTSHE